MYSKVSSYQSVLFHCYNILIAPSYLSELHCTYRIFINCQTVADVAQWLECRTSDRGVLGSNPAVGTSLRNFGNSVYPTLPVSFGGDT